MTHASNTPAPAAPGKHIIYVPGYSLAKLGMALLGLALIALSLQRLGPLTKLAFGGGVAQAEAVRIIRIAGDGNSHTYTTDAAVLEVQKKIEEARDRESVFWVEYRFVADGKTVEVRSPLGQHVKPLQPLRDANGLPSTMRVWYDTANPQRVALPLMFGTWFMPGMLAFFGVLGVFMGLLLWWNARKPIEMPDLSRSHGEVDAPKP